MTHRSIIITAGLLGALLLGTLAVTATGDITQSHHDFSGAGWSEG